MKDNAIHNRQELTSFVKSFVKKLSGGEVLLLSGELGAGKTTFVTELVKELGSEMHVTSPTFVLRNEYQYKDGELIHIDLYRLDKSEVKNLEFLESVGDDRVITCIEWPERILDVDALDGKKIHLRFTITGDESRSLSVD